jgi:hypothetical protein
MIRIRRGDGHPTWGATWIDLGRLRLIRCARHPSGRRTLDHPNAWMIIWRRRLPEWDPATSGHRETLPARLTEADRREFGVERADENEPDRVRRLQAFAPTACFQCDHPGAPKARKELVEIIRAIRHREPLPQPPDLEGDLPVNCCRRQTEREIAAKNATL